MANRLKQISTFCFAFVFSVFSINLFATGITANSTSASCDNSTLNTYSGTSNLQANWQANQINLAWYSDGTQITTVQDAAKTCTYDGSLSVPSNPPTKVGYTFNGWKIRGLPAGYTRLRYIEGGKNLNAYINLGYPATSTMRTLLIASITTNIDQQVIFGASNQTAYASGNPYSIDRFPTYTLIPNGGSYNGTACKLTTNTLLDTVYQFKINYPTVGTIGIDDVTKTANTTTSPISSKNLYVFGFNGNNTYSTTYSVGKMKLYGLTIWNGDTMAHNYIPAKNSSNVLGLYDTVTGAFLTNAGTGAFTAGPVVQ